MPCLRSTLVVLSTCAAAVAPLQAQHVGPADLIGLPRSTPVALPRYGSDSLQVGELRLPNGTGPFPVVVVIHGGCWRDRATFQYTGPLASALAEEGIATWNIEYRRLGNLGGGWPGSFLDVGAAIDYLRTLAPQYGLDLNRVVIVGHSSGAHLALWASGRPHLPATSPLRAGSEPLPVRAVVAIDGPLDMAKSIGVDAQVCGGPVVTRFMGGTPAEEPSHYQEGSPIEMLPLGVRQVVVVAQLLKEPEVTEYRTKAIAAGDRVDVVTIPEAWHFDMMSPTHSAWAPLDAAIRAALGLPPR